MNKELVSSLLDEVKKSETRMSDKHRENNFSGSPQLAKNVNTVSGRVALVDFEQDSGKLSTQIYINIGTKDNNWWVNFYPQYDHLAGMMSAIEHLRRVEVHNGKITQQMLKSEVIHDE